MRLTIVVAVLVAAVFAAAPKQLWNYTTANCVASTVAVGGGMAVTGTDGIRLIALDAKTGALRWAYGASMWVQNNPVIIGNLVVFPNNRGNLDAVDINDGTLVWRVTGGVKSPVLRAIRLNNGTLLWQTRVFGDNYGSTPRGSSWYAAQLGAPTIVGGVAYFGTCGPPSGDYAVSMDK